MKNSILKTAAVLILFVLSVSNQVNGQSVSQLTEKYDTYLKEMNTGVSIMVRKNGVNDYASLGNFNLDQKNVFNIGSATKKLTAILLLQQEEKGNLQLSDSIGKYLQPIKNVDGSLTIESLMRHRSGLGELVGRHYSDWFFSEEDSIYNTNFLEMIPAPKPDYDGKYDYVNTNYILLGHILENVTDKSYFDLLRENIFEPCGMNDSYPYVTKAIENLAHPTHNGKDVYENINHKFFAQYAFSAGSVASTLTDMAKFYNHLFTNGTLLSETSLDKLTDFDEANHGLGMNKFTYDGTTFYGHGGNNVGYAYREYYNPETKDLILIFSNTEILPFSKMIREDMVSHLSDKKSNYSFNTKLSKKYADNIGKYFFKEMNVNVELKSKNNHLFLNVQGMDLVLVSHNPNILSDVLFGIELEIDPNDNTILTFKQNGMTAKIEKVENL